MALKLNCDLAILKRYLQTENKVARSSHLKYIYFELKRYENSSQGKRSRSNVTIFEPLLSFTMWHIPTKSHQFLVSSFGDFVRTDKQTDSRTDAAENNTCSQLAHKFVEMKQFLGDVLEVCARELLLKGRDFVPCLRCRLPNTKAPSVRIWVSFEVVHNENCCQTEVVF